MMDLQDSRDLTYMFITHDLSVVKHISSEIAVMYLGQLVELAPTKELFANPLHPYTQALLDAIPIPNLKRRNQERNYIKGEVTSPIDPPPGCRFAARCPYSNESCKHEMRLTEIVPGHFVLCSKFCEC